MMVMVFLQSRRESQILYIQWLLVEGQKSALDISEEEDSKSILSHTVFHPDKQTKYEIWDEEDFASKKLSSGFLSELKDKSE